MPRKKSTETKTKSRKSNGANGHATPVTEGYPDVEKLKGPFIADGHLHFSPYDLTRYELAQYKVGDALKSLKLKKQELVQLQHDFEAKTNKIQQELIALTNLQKAAADELMSLQDELQATYKIDLKKAVYDDRTGRLRIEGT